MAPTKKCRVQRAKKGRAGKAKVRKKVLLKGRLAKKGAKGVKGVASKHHPKVLKGKSQKVRGVKTKHRHAGACGSPAKGTPAPVVVR